MTAALPPTTVSATTHDRLEAMIVLGQLAPGSMHSETSLSRLLEVGRTPVRESLQRLAREGLVAIYPKRGILITEVSVNDQLKLLEVRRILEGLAVGCAAARASEEQRADMQHLAARLEELGPRGAKLEFLAELRRAHHLLITAADNRYLAATMAAVQAPSRRFWILNLRPGDLVTAAGLHASILRAVAEGSTGAAENASAALLDYLEDFARATIAL
jgi:DNA-binding GntR family transcriptional regulator